MDYGPFSDSSVLDIVFWGGMVLLFLTIFLFSLIFFLRISLLFRNTGKRRLIDTWSPILEACAGQEFPEAVPGLREKDIESFLGLWLNYYETADENSREMLALVAMQAGLPKYLEKGLKRGAVRQKILFFYAIGALKDDSYWNDCLKGLQAENTFLSLSAARALLQLKPAQGINAVAEVLASRQDWPSARASMILMEAGMDLVSQPIARQIEKAPVEELPRLLPYLEITTSEVALPILEKYLATSSNEDVLKACLNAIPKFSSFHDTDLLLKLLKHPKATIRSAAVLALSNFLTFREGVHVADLLGDPVPMVQYCAAQALLNLPAMTEAKLLELRTLLTEPNAVDVLTRVIDEKRFRR